MANHWFLKDEHVEFRDSMTGIVREAAQDICKDTTQGTLGDEHTQCQHLFSKMYTIMQQRQEELSSALLCCSRIPDPVVELRYYRSQVRRDRQAERPQFVEKETGADFALALRVDLPEVLQAERSVLGQGKRLSPPSADLNVGQLRDLLDAAGPESAVYLLWEIDFPPTVVSAENVSSHARTKGKDRLYPDIAEFGQSLSDFFCESFLGLWFGRDYDPVKEGVRPPANSIPILYHFLHRSVPPPNVVYLGIGSGKRMRVRPGVYVSRITEIGK
jgi:hypothetical protein